jgi:hypothetical protein
MVRKILLSLSGDDVILITQSSKKNRNLFSFIGLLVFIIIIISFGAYLNLFLRLLPVLMALGISIFFTWMISNMYLLILHTLSKNLLPQGNSEGIPFFSTMARYGFLCVIGTIVSSSIGLMVFNSEVETYTKEYRIQKFEESKNKFSISLKKEIVDIEHKILKYKNDPLFMDTEKAVFLEKELAKKYVDLNLLEKTLDHVFSKSDFTIASIIILHKRVPEYWLLYVLFLIFIISPAIIKYFIRNENEYYQLRKFTEMQIIEDDYNYFKKTYSYLFQNLYKTSIEWREIYIDPPYNTKKKPKEKPYLSDQEILLKELYHG